MVWIPCYERWVCLDFYNYYYKDMILDDFIASKGESLVIHDKSGMIEQGLRLKYKDSFIQK
ncbi:MAG: hypothetical protein ACFFDK_01915 [Promethearchaeota archaeon]